MPTSMIAIINSDVATGLMIKGAEGFIERPSRPAAVGLILAFHQFIVMLLDPVRALRAFHAAQLRALGLCELRHDLHEHGTAAACLWRGRARGRRTRRADFAFEIG